MRRAVAVLPCPGLPCAALQKCCSSAALPRATLQQGCSSAAAVLLCPGLPQGCCRTAIGLSHALIVLVLVPVLVPEP